MSHVKHVAFLRFRSDVASEAIDEIFANLAALRDEIPGLLDFTGGPYASPEGLNRGYTHGFIMTFADAAARDAYLPHPSHQAIVQKVLPLLEGELDGAVVVDWVEGG